MILTIEKAAAALNSDGPLLRLTGAQTKSDVAILPVDFSEAAQKLAKVAEGEIFVWAGKVANYANKNDARDTLEIAAIGEFEKTGIFVTSQTNDHQMTEPLIDVVEIEIDGIRVLYYYAEEEFDKTLFDTIGDIDVLVLNVTEKMQNQIKAVGVVDPKVLIPISNSEELVQKFIKELGVQAAEAVDKYKCRKQDFEVEEYVTQVVQLKF